MDDSLVEFAGKRNIFLVAGAVAFLYGVGNYIRVTYLEYLPPYTTWMMAGLILLGLGWVMRSRPRR